MEVVVRGMPLMMLVLAGLPSVCLILLGKEGLAADGGVHAAGPVGALPGVEVLVVSAVGGRRGRNLAAESPLTGKKM